MKTRGYISLCKKNRYSEMELEYYEAVYLNSGDERQLLVGDFDLLGSTPCLQLSLSSDPTNHITHALYLYVKT